MIDKAFEEVKREAREGVVYFADEDGPFPIRIHFNIVDNKVLDDALNIYIKDRSKFTRVLHQYVNKALKFYSLECNYQNVKKIIAYSIVNISQDEASCLEDYLLKYLKFYEEPSLIIGDDIITKVGTIKSSIEKQTIHQETPYCFKSFITYNNSKYVLPRISFGINDGVCEVFSIQNKDRNENNDSAYSNKINKAFSTINSGISKYRNVTPSFVIALALFVLCLRENGINKIKVVTPLPIRRENRFLSMKAKIRFYTMGGNLTTDSVESLKKSIEEPTLRDDYNTTVKFVNCFNRLRLYFEDINFSDITKEMLLNDLTLSTNNGILNELIKRR